MLCSLAMYDMLIWFATRHESTVAARVYDSITSSSTGIHVAGGSSSGLSAMKSPRIWPQIDILGLTALIASLATDRYIISSSVGLGAVTDIKEMDKIKAKTVKTKYEMEIA
nr:hypothetical protein [Tanacetum cinerariifolium]